MRGLLVLAAMLTTCLVSAASYALPPTANGGPFGLVLVPSPGQFGANGDSQLTRGEAIAMLARFRVPPLRLGENPQRVLTASAELILEPGAAVLASSVAGTEPYANERDSLSPGTLRIPIGDLEQYAGQSEVEIPFTARARGAQAALVIGTLWVRGDIQAGGRASVLFRISVDGKVSLSTGNELIEGLRASFRRDQARQRQSLRAVRVLPYDPAVASEEESETVSIDEALKGVSP